ncbi:hypothetical protein Cva_01211 [Caedimonas varicaedens]|jgi:hypothetical protein|uniref:Uncharacterized protein n=1 Tax=Caedimonas varicaedens TaxID=1629334 RepID=A0A0K8MEB0_9PROT|nr:hypothetical protein Cva_01211 [Caedimonas varicaedens]
MIKNNRQSVLNLAEMDAAIIIKEDGTLEASLPEITTDTVPENVFTGAALVYALSNPEICQMIYRNFAQECVRRKSVSSSVIH